MDWSSITRYRGELAILLGFALLLNPVATVAPDLGDPDWYRYEASEVEFFENGTYDYEVPALPLDPEVACFEDLPSRSCMLELAAHAEGGLEYDGLPGRFLQHEYSYVHVWGEGFYRPTTAEGPNETTRYLLEPVPQAEALRAVATPIDRASPGVRTAVETGSVETSDELPGAHELVRAGDRYHVVYVAEAHSVSGERAWWVGPLRWLLGIVGAGLVLAGQRQRVER